MMYNLIKNLIVFSLLITSLQANEQNLTVTKNIENLKKPLYTPFVENYILHEIRVLRDENRDLKVNLHETLAQKTVEISNNAVNYASSTVNNMFYIIAAASSLLVIMGWNSIRDVNDKIKNLVDVKVSKVVDEYERRMIMLEEDLKKRSSQVIQNQKDIEETNIIHSLWMRVSQETTLNGKIDIYNEILEIRPDDVEAIIQKADAALDMGEANWALSLTNNAIDIEKEYADAFYQRAKVNSILGFLDSAVEDLEHSILLNEQYTQEIENEEKLENILQDERVQNLLSKQIT